MRISARKLSSLTGLIASTCLVLVACGGGATGPQPPKAASDVSATAGPGYITVSWSDNSDDETGFKILRSPAAEPTKASAQQAAEVGSVGPNVTIFVDRDIALDTQYEYSVVAENEAGSAAAAIAPSAASVPVSVELVVGTNNRRHDDQFNGTIFLAYFVLPDEVLDDGEDWTLTIVGPPGWNDDQPLVDTSGSESYLRERGTHFISENGITAIDGTYELTVDLPGEQYQATTAFTGADFMLPAPSDIEASGDLQSVTATWSPSTAGGSALLSLWIGDYSEFVAGYEITDQDSFTFTGLTLEDRVYNVEVATINADLTAKFPVVTEPFGLSYETASFGVGEYYSPLCAAADEEVAIPDEELLALVRASLELPTETITCDRMALLEAIQGPDAGVSSLEGLQYAPNLQEIVLNENDVSDLTPLAGLTGLWILDLNVNPVTDIGPLTNLVNLEGLHLCCIGTAFVDPTPLEGMTEMKWFNVSGRSLGDAGLAAILTQMPKMQMIWVGDNGLTDGAVFTELPDLGHIAADWNDIEDIGFIADVEFLWSLHVQGNPITDFSPLADETQLQELRLSDTDISDIDFLENYTSLSWLDLARTPITDISALAANTNIGAGVIVDISETALDLEDPDVMADIQTLLDRGVDLSY